MRSLSLSPVVSTPLALVAAIAALTGSAGAVTLTFDHMPHGPGKFATVVREKGVTISADVFSDGPLYHINPGTIHVDDSGTSNTAAVIFVTGGLFSALSMNVIGLSVASFVDDGSGLVPVPYDNVRVQGFRNGAEVAIAGYSTGLGGGAFTFGFGEAFGAIDLLRISAVTSAGQIWQGLPIECGDAPCGHFEIDSVTLAPVPVPVPAAFPVLAAGLGGLALLRRRRR